MAMHNYQLNRHTTEKTFSEHQLAFKSKAIELPASINQAIPRCTINPPHTLRVLKLIIPNNNPPQKTADGFSHWFTKMNSTIKTGNRNDALGATYFG